MASRIKGITVEIGGDTTGLDKALKNVNSSIRTTQSSLRDVNRLLKLDPKNTTLLAQKQKLLKQSIGSTKDKLEALKQAQVQAKQQLENGELGQDKYDALQREIVETENELKRLEAEAKTCESKLAKMAAVGDKMQKVGDGMTSAGKSIMPVSAAVAGLGAVSVKTAADFDSAMSKVSAVSGATGDDFDKLRDKAREMGAKTKFSATEAAEAMNYMAMAGWKTEDMLSGVEGIMNLAAASGEDLATTSDIVTDALTAFGLSAKDSGHFADILAAASSNANTNVSMMGETFKYAAPVAGALGFSAEDTAQAIGLMANAGIKSSQAGTSLRTIMTAMSKDFTISGKKIGDVTIATTNADGSMRSLTDILADTREAFSGLTESEQAATAKTLAGKNAMSGFLALMNASPKDIDKLQGALENCDGASEKMAETMQDNLMGQLTILKSQLQELAISFGDALMPAIRAIVSALQGFINHLNQMSEGTRRVILAFGLVIAALGPFLVILGTIISKVGVAISGFAMLAGKIAAFSAKVGGMSGLMAKVGAAIGGISLPIVAIVAVIAVLVATFMHLWKTNEKFRNTMISIWKSIKATVGKFIADVKARLDELGPSFMKITSVLKKVWNAFCKILAPLFEGAFRQVAIILKTVLNAIVGLLDIFIGLFTGDWKKVWQGVQEIVSAVWNGIQAIFKNYLTTIRKVIGVFLSWVGANWRSIWNSIKSFTAGLWNTMKGLASSVWSAIKNAVLTPIRAIKTTASSLWSSICSAASRAWNRIKSAMISPIESAKDKIGSILRRLKGMFPLSVGRIFSNIKLPHINISGGKAPWGIGGKGTKPTIGIDWYKTGRSLRGLLSSVSVKQGRRQSCRLTPCGKNLTGSLR